MHLRFLICNIVCLSVVLFLKSEIALPIATVVTSNTGYKNYYKKIAQVSPNNNSKSEVTRLNKEGIRLSEKRFFPQALEKLQKALTLTRDTGDRFLEAVTLNNIGRVYQNQGRYSPAFKFYLQALVINKELSVTQKNPEYALAQLGKTYSNIGYLFDLQKRPDLAIFFYKHCLINREKARRQPAVLSQPQPDAYNITVAQTYRLLSERLLAYKRVREALRSLDLLKVEELEGYLQNVPGNQRTVKGIDIASEEKPIKQKLDQTLQNAILEGKELIEIRKIPAERRSPQQQKRINELVANQQKILDEFNDFITSPNVKEQSEQISRTARRENLDLESLNDIRANLMEFPQKSVLLYPLVLKDSLELIVVTPESPPIHRTVAVTREQLYQTIASFRQSLQPSQNIKKPAQQLYDWLIKPIEKDLKVSGAQTLIYAPDDQLRYIPLAALYDGKQWLVQRFSINNITAASLTRFNTSSNSQLHVLAAAFTKGSYQVKVANRQFTLSGLPFAAREVETLANVVPGTKKLLGDAFSPKTTVPQLDDYTIVHFATHAGFVVGKPEDSFILFGNGEHVTLKDVANWSLPHVDLVVLSACETAVGGKLGNGEEILGFGYQIQKTGARAAIASLWTVDDGGTQALMSAFYTLLSSGKLTKAEALQQAQIALITGNFPKLGQHQSRSHSVTSVPTDNFSHPYYWAPFILIGNGL
ncbi:CHAT domain-containing protein [Aetokthonos hydrillicola Thurmond2011]|jgi:CHAT domain-containing protein|uniref:CHAT domain-containing protein n=1 Tax=Aetokthonos hydrillicola Thurmond2011 TaxID=2712845 RepID=A0AAP5IGF5_9CYAN|nr:CHAT domain-containing protein [Aetokthonos hydrillicola]MBO3463228.1 CHAT domain-containing protein [Aetokthonos hydrillicola CCALA 1050]MBW4590722.1 CHAT domain-containing protein [Aetokthonos hydrillicola CCALA 1050]MDR9899772.1 CHAT domain-containing protein [Aetokthonos hydrillicola Thurmond2011]